MAEEQMRQGDCPPDQDRLAEIQRTPEQGPPPAAVRIVDPVEIRARQNQAPLSDQRALWIAIQNRSAAMSFNRYRAFIAKLGGCPDVGEIRIGPTSGACQDAKEDQKRLDHLTDSRLLLPKPLHGVDAYLLLKAATELFLLRECGVRISQLQDLTKPAELITPGFDEKRLGEPLDLTGVQDMLKRFAAGRLPFFGQIVQALGDQLTDSPYCFGILKTRLDCPCLLELIWSYWHEEGMLVQTIAAVALRFQNRRGPAEKDPLATMEIGALRPLNNLLWGYIQDEHNRLTVARRAYEYDHHYGLTIFGKAVPELRPADSRSKFLAAFHNLLHRSSEFYKQAANLMVVPDTFPLLEALKETHLLLAEGMHNQYGDLPWTARVEMLIQQWLLARPEIRDFLRTREMVVYPEAWMGQVDAMKTLQGWTDTNVRHFRDLAVYGEQLLLSVRFGNWSEIANADEARLWAEFWRPEIQGYLHSYRAVTGVDLTNPATVDATPPWVHLKRRLRPGAAV